MNNALLEANLRKQEELLAIFERSDTKELQDILKNPMKVIEEIGFDVNDEYRTTVEENLKHVAFEKVSQTDSKISPSTGRNIVSTDGISFSAQPWGLVLELDNQVTQSIVNGVSIVAGIAAAITSVATAFAAPAGIVAGVFSAYCALYATVLKIVNQGNGVYLTLTWPQIALITIFPPVPVPTTR